MRGPSHYELPLALYRKDEVIRAKRGGAFGPTPAAERILKRLSTHTGRVQGGHP